VRSLLQKRSTRWSEGVFVAEGAELLRTALRAGAPIESVYLAPQGEQDPATLETCEQALLTGARLFPLAPGVLERVADTVTPQPVLTVLPMMRGVAAESGLADPAEQPLIVVLVDVRDPGNAGTVLRTADAAGVDAVIFSGESVDPYNPKTVRASAGSLFHVPFSVQADPVALAASLAGRGYRTLATVAREGEDYAALDWSVPTVLFLGNEAAGLGPEVRQCIGGAVAIPMDGRAESLNVGVACAVLCFEALRQRRSRGGVLAHLPFQTGGSGEGRESG
jgi:TrmH family RNA methyltransferase